MDTVISNKQIKLAKRYASALMSFEDVDNIFQQLKEIAEVLKNSQDLKNFLENPIIRKEDKKSVIVEIFAQITDKNVLNFLKLLIDKNRFIYFNSILYQLSKEIDLKHNLSRIAVISAVDLSEDEKRILVQKISEKLSKEIKPTFEIQQDIIGGLIIKLGDKIIDTSIKAKLNSFKKQLT